MKRNDLFFFGGLALLAWGVWQFLKGRSAPGIPANQFGSPLTQAPGPQLRYGAPQLNDTGRRPVVSRANEVLGTVQSGVAVAFNLGEAVQGLVNAAKNLLSFEKSTDRQVLAAEEGREYVGAGGQTYRSIPEAGASFPLFGNTGEGLPQNSEGFDSGGFDPERPFDRDVFAA